MSELDPIIQVNITVEQDTVARTSFGIPGIMAEFLANKTTVAFTRAREYSSTADMLEDGWVTGDDPYKAALKCFAQNPKPAKIIIGRRDTADADWATAFTAINAENDDWYGFTAIPTSAVESEISDEIGEIAAWTESTGGKIYWPVSGEAGILVTATTTDTASDLKALNYRRTALTYHPAAKKDEHIGIAWFAEGAPYRVGSSTYEYKTPAGCTTDKLTGTQRTAAFGKNCNLYQTIGGTDVMRRGMVSSGEFIYVVIGVDWLTARIQEAVFAQLVATRKISYDDAGIAAVASIVQGVLEEGARNGVLQAGSITMTIPKYKDIPAADRAAGKLTGIKFGALLQGAVSTAEIEGNVTV